MGAMAKIAILALEGVQPGSRIRSQGFGSENPLRIQRFPPKLRPNRKRFFPAFQAARNSACVNDQRGWKAR